MFKNIKKKFFRRSVQKLLIGRDAVFALNRPGLGAMPYVEGKPYTYISRWDDNFMSSNGYAQLVNQCFADGLNKHETAATMISGLIAVDIEEDEPEEYARLYGIFQDSPKVVHKKLNDLCSQGEIRTDIKNKFTSAFSNLYKKYPEFRKEVPSEPVEIFWWELAHNDHKADELVIQGCFETVQEVVDYISSKERTDELFWEYPRHDTPREWEPTTPPVNGYDDNRIFAMPRRAWDVFWNKCDGILLGSNFDHWEALKKSAFVRPADQHAALHRVLDKPYQKEMFG
ncbi:MAG: hypothetical protein KDI13_01410 [Alphaproteobacteria bacterium]|nr:hypothetical protein [Alphaproteobacteria bacterium]